MATKRKNTQYAEQCAHLADPEASAAQAGLDYVLDGAPGYTRRRCGRGFTYLDEERNHIKDEAVRTRLEDLVIPPAWTDVWICPSPRGHLQATGRDAEGRKQYLYHPEWQRVRNDVKFNRMLLFGEALPQIRARCEHDLRLRSLSREKVLATVVCLLDRTLIRIGNPAYARQNGSFGLTTLRDRHVDFSGSRCTFTFKGKSGKKHCIELNDPRLARLVRHCRDVPGYELFQYYDDDGQHHAICASDVNAYLRETTGDEFTAKDFRTWGGTVHAAVTLQEIGDFESEAEAEKNVVETIKRVAARLGNTTAVCRKYYVHPALLTAYLEGTFLPTWSTCLEEDPLPQLDPDESAVLRFLRARVLD